MDKKVVDELEKHAGKVLDKLLEYSNKLVVPLSIASIVAPPLVSAYETWAEPRRREKQFQKLIEEYPELKRMTYGGYGDRQGRPIPLTEVRKAFDVGYHLAPHLMKNPVLARQITRNIAESAGISQDFMRNIAGTEQSVISGTAQRLRMQPPLAAQVGEKTKQVAQMIGDLQTIRYSNDPIAVINALFGRERAQEMAQTLYQDIEQERKKAREQASKVMEDLKKSLQEAKAREEALRKMEEKLRGRKKKE